MTGAVHTTPATFAVDTETAVTLFRADLWERARPPGAVLEPWTDTSQWNIDALGCATVTLTMAATAFPARVVVVNHLRAEVILGEDFLIQNVRMVQVGNKQLDFPNLSVSAPLSHFPSSDQVVPPAAVFLVEAVRFPAFSEMVMTRNSVNEDTWILETEHREKVSVLAARAVATPAHRTLPVRLLNPRAEAATVYKGTQIACLEPVGNFDISDPATIASVQHD